ncbi:Uncharacterised protein [BD1-7 clade bacterium]|uniref:Uncharacterized protein n=1 Tax=BD1-7 clade bacterium TaxID=2029982 RepID=A0A5S9PL76_9GAMM|nr:Uncharacterised protein [BD1-7 clade bacterium]
MIQHLSRFTASLALLAFATYLHANAAQNFLMSLPEDKRKTVIAGAINSGALTDCTQIDKLYFDGLDKNNNAHWFASCGENNNYRIYFRDDATGTSRIDTCGTIIPHGITCKWDDKVASEE